MLLSNQTLEHCGILATSAPGETQHGIQISGMSIKFASDGIQKLRQLEISRYMSCIGLLESQLSLRQAKGTY